MEVEEQQARRCNQAGSEGTGMREAACAACAHAVAAVDAADDVAACEAAEARPAADSSLGRACLGTAEGSPCAGAGGEVAEVDRDPMVAEAARASETD